MYTEELNGQKVSYYWNSPSIIDLGGFIKLIPYRGDTLLKLYCYSYPKTTKTGSMEQLEEEIALKKEKFKERDLYRLSRKLEQLQNGNQKSSLEGIALFKHYPIGVIKKWNKEYETLENIYSSLLPEEKTRVLEKLKEKIIELEQLGFFPYGITTNTILVNPRTLEIEISNLDEEITSFIEWDKVRDYQYINNSYNNIVKQLGR